MAKQKPRQAQNLPPAGTYPVDPELLARSEALLPRLRRSRWTRLEKMLGLLAAMSSIVLIIYVPGLEKDARVIIARVWVCVFGVLTFRAFLRFIFTCCGVSVRKETLDEYREGRHESGKFTDNYLNQAARFADGGLDPLSGSRKGDAP